MQVFLIVVLLGALHSETAQPPQARKRGQISADEDEKCVVKDGRDGLPGYPGPQGPTGLPGRDGRDCSNELNFVKVLQLEKRVEELTKRIQSSEQKARRTMAELRAYQSRTDRLSKLLTESGSTKSVDISGISEQQPTDFPFTNFDEVYPAVLASTALNNVAEQSGGPGERLSPHGQTRKTPTQTTEEPTQTTEELSMQTTQITETLLSETREQSAITIETRMKEQGSKPAAGEKKVLSNVGKYFTGSRPTAIETETESKIPPPQQERKECNKRFRIYQEILTQGAVNMDIFEIGNTTYLAVANFHLFNSKDGYHTDSYVYRMNHETGLFELYQKLPTFGCRALVSFFRDGAQYLVAANHYDGHKHSLLSIIYKWDDMKFQEYQHVQTYGASSAQFFTFDGNDFLLFANYRNRTTVSVYSVVYKWVNDQLEVFQQIQTNGAVDGKFFQSKNGDAFLVFANFYTQRKGYNVESIILKWNGAKFVFWQSVKTSAATCVEMFEIDNTVFLAVASHRTTHSWHSDSIIFRWNGTEFEVFQEIHTTAAVKIHHFYDNNDKLYLTIANYFDEITDYKAHSMIYQFDGERFQKFQGLVTIGSYDLKPFTYKGVPFLASAFRFDGRNSTLRSRIYKMSTSCEEDRSFLP